MSVETCYICGTSKCVVNFQRAEGLDAGGGGQTERLERQYDVQEVTLKKGELKGKSRCLADCNPNL